MCCSCAYWECTKIQVTRSILNCIVLKCLVSRCIFLIHSLEKNRFPAKLYFSIDTEFDQILSRMIKTFKTASNIGIYKNKNILVIPCYDMITCHRLLIDCCFSFILAVLSCSR